jgi:hypothetical protein
MEIQKGSNTMDHCFTSILNYHAKLMWWHVRRENIVKMHT